MATKFLFAASEAGLFEALSAGPATIEEIANRTGCPTRTIALVAAAMVIRFAGEHERQLDAVARIRASLGW